MICKTASSSDLLELVVSGYLPVRKGSVRQGVQTDSQEDRMLNDHPPPRKTPLVLDQGLADRRCAAQTGAGCQGWPGAGSTELLAGEVMWLQ